jgi:hypothetical protein
MTKILLGNLKGPKGDKGDKGDSVKGDPGPAGPNTVPTNEAIAAAVAAEGPARAALDAAIGEQIEAALEDYTPGAAPLIVDAGSDLSTPRPAYSGKVWWYITDPDGVPLFAIDRDEVFPYEDLPVPDPTAFLDTYTGLLSRWRADDLSASSGSIATVPSRAGSAAVALTAPAAQPTLETLSSHKVLKFTASASQYMQAAFAAFNSPFTVVGVIDANTAGRNPFGSGGSGASYFGMAVNGGGTTIRLNTYADLGGGVSAPWSPSTGLVAFVAVYSPGTENSRLYYNALTPVTGTTHPSTHAVDSTFRVASSYLNTYMDLSLADLAFISGAVPDADAKTMLQALANYFGLTLGA